MKKFYVFLAAMAGMTFVSCTNDDIVGENTVVSPNEQTPIVFGSLKSGMTRADITGKDAADLLGNQFVVSGYKGSATGTVGSMVFDNYKVVYAENTANTTESNSTNWEYVGVDRIKHAIDKGITSQTIKYWDYSKPQYDFIAWSTGKKKAIYDGTPADGEVLVSAITPATATGATATQAYTFTGKANDLKDCYIADLVTVAKANYGNDPVTFHFRQLGTKVRIALYETVPGYSVKNVQFYSAAASNDASAAAAKLFTTTANDIYTEGTYTVTFPTVDDAANNSADNNQAHVKFTGTGTQATTISWDKMSNYTIAEEGEKTAGNVFLGRTSNTATFAGKAADNYYVVFLPNETGTNLNLRVNYTLESIDGSGETIEVKGATAQVPSIYTQWKPGFAYTYIFKISDKTNGYTGVYDPTNPDNTTVNSDPAGLWPITFDAVVENAEDKDATQETITLVSTPSITTYQKGSTVVNDDEYKAATGDIFVTVNDGNTESTPDLANGKLQTLTGKAALYTIPAGKTEAEVVDALSMQDDDAAAGTIKGRSGLVLTEATFSLVDKVEFGVDGNAVAVATDQALRFTPAAGSTYAFVYTKKAATTNEEKFQPVSKTKGASVAGLYRYALKNAPAGDVKKGVTYFTASDKDMVSNIFLGQGVSNLYLDAAGNQIASGYAVTGTDYYYTTDKGMTYEKATNIAYEAFASTTLYTDPAHTTEKTETTPVDGQAYYDATGKYCVILPQQTNPAGGDRLKIVDETAAKILCTASKKAVVGMTYFDKYTKNDGVYYTKVIKVQ
ncbi:MAG: hypothetical protein IJ546_01945 [Prevotella sp.]|nr:hypothetical protein [Prevotella sp.]